VLNAAAALAAFEKRPARLHDAIAAGMARAVGAIDDGRAAAQLQRWVTVSQAAR
jgi:anthranilate phosphoribosyltransferase